MSKNSNVRTRARTRELWTDGVSYARAVGGWWIAVLIGPFQSALVQVLALAGVDAKLPPNLFWAMTIVGLLVAPFVAYRKLRRRLEQAFARLAESTDDKLADAREDTSKVATVANSMVATFKGYRERIRALEEQRAEYLLERKELLAGSTCSSPVDSAELQRRRVATDMHILILEAQMIDRGSFINRDYEDREWIKRMVAYARMVLPKEILEDFASAASIVGIDGYRERTEKVLAAAQAAVTRLEDSTARQSIAHTSQHPTGTAQ